MFGLYIHIPFCVAKCGYCDFNSGPALSGEIDEYLSALIEEIKIFAKGNRRIVETLYLGGGTPTLLSEGQFTQLLNTIRDRFTLLEDIEITVEANPGTLDRSKAEHLLALGVNRISLGVQSLHDSLLSRMGRVHSSAQSLETFKMLSSAGFRNVGIDLIYALPGQKQKDWEEDLVRILALKPEHLSLYGLSVEKGTLFDRELKAGTLDLPSEGEEIRMFYAARGLTGEAGYEHYEISNYARPKYQSRHNRLYWAMQEYYGAGAGAHSFFRIDGPLRFSNVTEPSSYIQRMKGSKDPVSRRELLPQKTLLAEAMMLGLRMTEGVEIQRFQQEYGVDPLSYFSESLSRAYEKEWLEVEKGRVRLTDTGLILSNEVFMDLF